MLYICHTNLIPLDVLYLGRNLGDPMFVVSNYRSICPGSNPASYHKSKGLHKIDGDTPSWLVFYNNLYTWVSRTKSTAGVTSPFEICGLIQNVLPYTSFQIVTTIVANIPSDDCFLEYCFE